MVEASEAKSQEASKCTPDGSEAKSDSFEEKLKKKNSVFGAIFCTDFCGGMGEASAPTAKAPIYR